LENGYVLANKTEDGWSQLQLCFSDGNTYPQQPVTFTGVLDVEAELMDDWHRVLPDVKLPTETARLLDCEADPGVVRP
jgi:hypothetical protein